MVQMLNRAAAHEHRVHPVQVGTVASGHIAAGGTARFRWDGTAWVPELCNDAAFLIGPLSDHELRARLSPDLQTIKAAGPHWGHGHRFAEDD